MRNADALRKESGASSVRKSGGAADLTEGRGGGQWRAMRDGNDGIDGNRGHVWVPLEPYWPPGTTGQRRKFAGDDWPAEVPEVLAAHRPRPMPLAVTFEIGRATSDNSI